MATGANKTIATIATVYPMCEKYASPLTAPGDGGCDRALSVNGIGIYSEAPCPPLSPKQSGVSSYPRSIAIGP
ncbi:MAG: hypothetical protein EBE86_019675 [Hormoscilla sp. GUM202]|nr:hypothetical protein [Hormoscilla sp. GUM202]